MQAGSILHLQATITWYRAIEQRSLSRIVREEETLSVGATSGREYLIRKVGMVRNYTVTVILTLAEMIM